MDKGVEKAFDAINELHTELLESGDVTNDQFLTALEMVRDVVTDDVHDDDDEDEEGE